MLLEHDIHSMNQKKASFAFLFTLCSFSALPPLLSAHAVNLVILGEVQYPATVTDASGAARPAREGQLVADGYTVTTGKNGSIVLLFSNGSTVTLAGNTRFSVSRFFQETHRESTDLENLDIEPSRSTTRLKLDYGEIVGHTRRLRTASTYEIETPIGIAGIRGTTYSINVTVEPITKAFPQLEISVVEGIIGFKGSVATLLELNQLLKEALAGPKPDPVKEWFSDRFREIGAGQRIIFKLRMDAKTRLPKLKIVEATVDTAERTAINMIVEEASTLLKKAIQRGAFDEAYR